MKFIPYGRQSIDGRDIRAVTEVMRSDFLTQGPKVGEFEKALCEYTGARFCVAVSSGTAALHIAALAAGLRPGFEAITSPITFVASANCALYCGARAVFADIRPDTVNIDPVDVAKRISRRTKAIIPVHFAGLPCEMDAIRKIGRKNGCVIIEDAAHALGAEYKGSRIGSCEFSDMAVFSFHPVKAITTGEGGAVMTNDKTLFRRLSMLRTHGITRGSMKNKASRPWYYEMVALGYNYRITDIQSALGISQLNKLDKFIRRRREIASLYAKAFSGVPWFNLPVENEGCRSAFHLFPVRLKNRYAPRRARVFNELRRRGIGVQVHYIPAHLHPFYRNNGGFRKGAYPNAEAYYRGCFSLPLFPGLTRDDISRVIRTVKDVCGGICGSKGE